jgi:O-antigen ligase
MQEKILPPIPWAVFPLLIIMGVVEAFHLEIPRLFMLLISLVVFVPLAIRSLSSRLAILLALVVYIPYSKAIPGTMGGALVGLNFTSMLMILAMMSALTTGVKNGPPVPQIPEESNFRRYVLIFAGLGLFSVLHTDLSMAQWTLGESLVDYKRWVEPILIFFLFSYLVESEEEARLIVITMALGLTVVGIVSWWEHHEIAGYHHRVRLRGIAGQANEMGAFFDYYASFLLGLVFFKEINSRWRLAFGIGFFGCLMGLFGTASRGGLLAFVVSLFVLLFYVNKKILWIGVAGVIFLVFNLTLLPEGIKNRLQHTVSHKASPITGMQPTLDTSARTRLVLWMGALRMIRDHPVTGVGYKVFPYLIGGYVPHKAEDRKLKTKNRDAHNAYLLIAAEMGLPTLIVFVGLIVGMAKVAIRCLNSQPPPFWKRVSAGTLAGVSGLAVANLFGSRVASLVLTGYLWILVAILLKVPSWKVQKVSQEKS